MSPLYFSGALILELNNKEVAEQWLKLTPSEQFDVAVYFDSRDILQTIDRNGVVVAYDCSVYRDNLSRCLVYLDDVHTRGTDLKFPLSWIAGVTLSGDTTRDKTVQSCMRMRQLGKTHSISFWASHEADIRIRQLCGLASTDDVTNENIIEFIAENSKQFEKANIVHWAAAGGNYTKKLVGHKLNDIGGHENAALDHLYDWCVDEEFVHLIQMYGQKEEAFLTEITESKLNRFALQSDVTDEIRQFIATIKSNMIEKLQNQAPNLKRFTHSLDEEQEKELEKELEEHREVQRPPESQPAAPYFDHRLVDLVLNGVQDALIDSMIADGALMSLANSLAHTQLFHSIGIEGNAWAEHLMVTRDFKTVIVSKTAACDQFLRPVWWIAQIKHSNDGGQDRVILLSSYECNELKLTFQNTIMATLYMYRARSSKFHDNLVEIPALQLTGLFCVTRIDINDEIQIGVYSGMLYFNKQAEMDAYCKVLGLIPRPRTEDQEEAVDNGIIQPNGFVPSIHRRYSESISNCVGQCTFLWNPTNLVMRLIEAHQKSLPREAHVLSILVRGNKPDLD